MAPLSVWPRVVRLVASGDQREPVTLSRACTSPVFFTAFSTRQERALWLESQRLFLSTMDNMVNAHGVV